MGTGAAGTDIELLVLGVLTSVLGSQPGPQMPLVQAGLASLGGNCASGLTCLDCITVVDPDRLCIDVKLEWL